MQRLQNNMDKLLYRTDLGEYGKARQYMQLQNRFLAFKQQLNSIPRELNPLYSEEQREISNNLLPGHVPPLIQEPVTVQSTAVQTPTTIQVTTAKHPMAAQATPAEASLPSSILTPPPTVELMSPPKKRKRPRIPQLKNYLDDDAQKTYGPFRRVPLQVFWRRGLLIP